MDEGMFYLRNIHMEGNEHGQLKKNTIYAELYDCDGRLSISATLDDILIAIRDNRLAVPGVTVEWGVQRGVYASTVRLKDTK